MKLPKKSTKTKLNRKTEGPKKDSSPPPSALLRLAPNVLKVFKKKQNRSASHTHKKKSASAKQKPKGEIKVDAF